MSVAPASRTAADIPPTPSMRHTVPVLLTATIRPASYDIGTVVRSAIDTRIADYVDGLNFWNSLPDTRVGPIVFCENSGEDLSPIIDATRGFRRPVEILGFKDPPPPKGVHYGYGELGIIDHALQHSTHMRGARHFIKSTGRLTFPRIAALLDALPEDFSWVIDHRGRYRSESGPPTRCRTQLMLLATDFYRDELFGTRDEMPGLCSHIEEFLAIRLHDRQFDPPARRRFPVECPPRGVGGLGMDYDAFDVRIKNTVRSLLRQWLPWLWL